MTRSAPDAVIRTEGLGKTFGRTTALTALDLAVDAGEVFGYLGPNGAGKTTTLRLLMGMLRPSTGRARCSAETPGATLSPSTARSATCPASPSCTAG